MGSSRAVASTRGRRHEDLTGVIFVDKRPETFARGDVIVFEFPADRTVDYIKRVIAVGGDRLAVKDGILFVNDKAVLRQARGKAPDDPSMRPGELYDEILDGRTHTLRVERPSGWNFGPVVVPPEHLFVMGDNRDNSNDSRSWGTVPLENVKGIARSVWWSSSPAGEVRWERMGQAVR